MSLRRLINKYNRQSAEERNRIREIEENRRRRQEFREELESEENPEYFELEYIPEEEVENKMREIEDEARARRERLEALQEEVPFRQNLSHRLLQPELVPYIPAPHIVVPNGQFLSYSAEEQGQGRRKRKGGSQPQPRGDIPKAQPDAPLHDTTIRRRIRRRQPDRPANPTPPRTPPQGQQRGQGKDKAKIIAVHFPIHSHFDTAAKRLRFVRHYGEPMKRQHKTPTSYRYRIRNANPNKKHFTRKSDGVNLIYEY